MVTETTSREMLLTVAPLGSFVTSTTATMDPEQRVTTKSLSLPKVTVADFVFLLTRRWEKVRVGYGI